MSSFQRATTKDRPVMSQKVKTNQTLRAKTCQEWVQDITIPSQYSRQTMTALEEGILLKGNCTEVVNAVCSEHEWYPTSAEYNYVCEKILEKYPKSADSNGYVCVM